MNVWQRDHLVSKTSQRKKSDRKTRLDVDMVVCPIFPMIMYQKAKTMLY